MLADAAVAFFILRRHFFSRFLFAIYHAEKIKIQIEKELNI